MKHNKRMETIKRILVMVLTTAVLLGEMPVMHVEAANELPEQTQPAEDTAPENSEETESEDETPEDGETAPTEKETGEEENPPADKETGDVETTPSDKETGDDETDPSDKDPEEGENPPADKETGDGENEPADKENADEEDAPADETPDEEGNESGGAVSDNGEDGIGEEEPEEETAEDTEEVSDISISGNHLDSVSENTTEILEPEEDGIRVVGGNIDLPEDWDVPVVNKRARISDYNEEAALLMKESVPTQYEPAQGSLPLTRSQNPYGSCWAHSAMALAEMDMMKNGGVTQESADYSEMHLCYFAYNGAAYDDPLGGLAGDKNSRADGNIMGAGNIALAKNVLMNWVGAADESVAPYPQTETKLPDDELRELVPKDSTFSDVAHLQNIYKVNLKENADDAKSMIMKYGGIGVSYYDVDSSNFYNDGHKCYYQNTYKKTTNHAVTAVGWDNNFSKDNFTTKPEGDGAWLIRNSWLAGEDTDSRKKTTYFWLSYYDPSLADAAYAFDFESADNYHHNYQYDGGMYTASYPITPDNADAVVRIANVFKAKAYKKESLEAVGVAFEEAQVPYSISIYTDLKDGNDPESGTLAGEMKPEKSAWAGFYTIPLTNPVNLTSGESFSVVVELGVPLGSTSNEVSAAGEVSADDWFKCEVMAQSGQSFYNSGSEWKDFGAEKKANLRIKAYTVDEAGETEPQPTGIRLSQKLQDGIEVGLGDSCQFTYSYTIQPSSVTDQRVTWTSSDPSVVTVDEETGKITGMQAGTATITITSVAAPSVQASFDVTVFAELRRIKITGDSSVTAGKTLSLQTVRTPSSVSPESIQWESSDERVLTVNADGVVTGVAPGYATVTAGIGEVTASKEITCEFQGFVWKDASSSQEIKWSPSAEGATIQWPGDASVKSYRLYRYDSDNLTDKNKKLLTEITAKATQNSYSYTDKTVEGGKVYRYLVEATVLYMKGNDSEEQIKKTKIYKCPEMPYYYPITYCMNGGTNSDSNPAYYRVASSSNYIYNPKTRTGYTFTGWYFDENLTQKLEGKYLPSDLSGPIALYAGWTPITYSISYSLNGGTNHKDNPSSFTIETESFTLKEPTKSGYRFAGWYTDSAYTKPISEIQKGVVYVTSGTQLVLYAKWREAGAMEYGELTLQPESFTYTGEEHTPQVTVTLDGDLLVENRDYTISYHNNKDAGTATVVAEGIGDYHGSLSRSFEIAKAVVRIRAKDMTILIGSGVPSAADYEYEVTGLLMEDTLTKNPVMRCDITEADTKKAGRFAIVPSGADAGSNYTIEYEEGYLLVKSEYLVYEVSFDVQGCGTPPTPLYDVKAGSTIDAPAVPEAEGYVFKGWCKDAACTVDWDFEADIVQSDITLYARWLKKSAQTDNTFQMQEIEDIYYYTGNACKPAVRVYDGETLLKAGRDYTVKYVNNINANAGGVWKKGSGQGADFNQSLPYVQITGKGNYTDEVKVNFDIHPAKIADEKGDAAPKVVLRCTEQFVTAKRGVLKPFSSIKYIKGMKQDRDYRLTLTAVNVRDGDENAVDNGRTFDKAQIPAGYAGTFLLKVEGVGNYEGGISKTIQVTDKDHLMKNARITLGKNQKSVALVGESVELTASTENSADTFTVKLGNTILTPDEDYAVSYLNDSNKKVGKATLVVTGQGAYAGTKTAKFTVKGKPFTAKTITVTGIENKVYTGRAITQNDAVLVYNAGRADEKQLTYGRDYTVSYAKNINRGNAVMTFKSKPESGFSGSFKKSFQIAAESINTVKRADDWDGKVEYSKAGAKPAERLSFTNAGGMSLKNGKDYTISYKNNRLVANSAAEKAPTIIVKGKGNYAGSFSIPFTITKADLRSKWEKQEITIRPIAVAYQPNKADDYVYKPTVRVLEGKTALRAGKDVAISYRNNTQADYQAYIQSLDAGNTPAPAPVAVITVTAESDYVIPDTDAEGKQASQEIVVPLTIYRHKLTKKNISVEFPSEITYTGTQVKPAVSVYYLDGEGKRILLTEKKDYTLSYGANNRSGKNAGSVTISGIGSDYGADVTVKFTIQKKKILY